MLTIIKNVAGKLQIPVTRRNALGKVETVNLTTEEAIAYSKKIASDCRAGIISNAVTGTPASRDQINRINALELKQKQLQARLVLMREQKATMKKLVAIKGATKTLREQINSIPDAVKRQAARIANWNKLTK
jgi:hypothetical protein